MMRLPGFRAAVRSSADPAAAALDPRGFESEAGPDVVAADAVAVAVAVAAEAHAAAPALAVVLR